MSGLQISEYRQQAIFLLQEMSTALRYLSVEIDDAVGKDRDVDHDLLRRISQALQKQQTHLLKIAQTADPHQRRRDGKDVR